jgi:hypothetical protein
MSTGEQGERKKPAHPYAEIEFDRVTLASKMALRVAAVQDADGDLRGAHARMRDTIIEVQRDVDAKAGALSTSLQEGREELDSLGLIGRSIDFTAGKALAAVDFSDPENPYVVKDAEGDDLARSGGVITGVEFGTFLGDPIAPPESTVLFVDMDPDKGHLAYAIGESAYRYAVIADQAEFRTGEIPEPGPDA